MMLTIEGRRVGSKLTKGDLSTLEHQRFADDARRGSAMLRDAILLAKGIAPPPVKHEPRPFPVAHREPKPKLCPVCDAPFKPQKQLIAHVQETVAAYYGINVRHMVGEARGREIARPRQVAMYLARELSGKSFPDIGRRFGNRDHTTVMHAVRAVEQRIREDDDTLLDVEVLRERLSA